MRSRIIGSLATVILFLALSTTAIAGDHLAATTTAFPDDPGIPTNSDTSDSGD